MSFSKKPFGFSKRGSSDRKKELLSKLGISEEDDGFLDLFFKRKKQDWDLKFDMLEKEFDRKLSPVNLSRAEAAASGSKEDYRKPKVRYIPIEIETREYPTKPEKTHKTHVVPIKVEDPIETTLENPQTLKKVEPTQGSSPLRKSATLKKFSFKPATKMGALSSKVNKEPSSFKINPETLPDPLREISKVCADLEDLKQKTKAFQGNNSNKEYRYLDEMLTRCMLKLDNIDTMGKDYIRSARKAAINECQNCLSNLEAKLKQNNSNEPFYYKDDLRVGTLLDEKYKEFYKPTKEQSSPPKEAEHVENTETAQEEVKTIESEQIPLEGNKPTQLPESEALVEHNHTNDSEKTKVSPVHAFDNVKSKKFKDDNASSPNISMNAFGDSEINTESSQTIVH